MRQVGRLSVVILLLCLVVTGDTESFPSPASPVEQQGNNAVINTLIRRFLSDNHSLLGPEIAAIESGATADPAALQLSLRELYAKIMPSLLPLITSDMEVVNAREFFDGFFLPEDNNPEIVRIFQETTDRLAAGRERRDLIYKTSALNDMGLMGFNKGGEIIIVSGDAVKWGQDEMAAMIAHEMAHLDARHYVLNLIVSRVNEMVLAGVSAGAQSKVKSASESAKLALQRQSEFDADEGAVKFMRGTGYNAHGLLELLRRADAEAGTSPISGDHPAIQSRIQHISPMI